MKNKSLAHVFLAALALLSLLVPDLALAQMFTNAPGDKFQEWVMTPLFGDFASSPLRGPVEVFNGAVLFVGGILAAYTLLAGTLQTAHDGEMLGKRWSSVWLPLRTAVFTAMLLPAMSGFCMMQAAVVWGVNQGGGLANALWTQYATHPSQGAVILPSAASDQIGALAVNMLKANLCVARMRKEFADPGNAPMNQMHGNPDWTVMPFRFAGEVGFNYGTQTGNSGQGLINACGRAALQLNVPVGALNTSDSSVANEIKAGLKTKNAQMELAQAQAFAQLQSAMAPLAQAFLANPQIDVVGPLDAAVAAFKKTVEDAAKKAFGSGADADALAAAVKADGWIMAGSLQMKVVAIQDAIANAVQKMPSSQSAAALDGSLQVHVEGDFAALDSRLKTFGSKSGATSGMKQLADESDGIRSRLSRAMLENLRNGGLFMGEGPGINPILAAKGVGDSMINTGWALTILVGGLSIFVSSPFIAMIAFSFVITLWVTGAGLAFVLPMLPFMIWFGTVCGYVILVMEAMFAAPLWAVVHLHPDGDGVVGKGGQGYMLVLSLVLRPALMILGIIAAFTLMPVFGHFLNSVFAGTFSLMIGDAVMGPVSIVAMLGLYMAMMLTVVKKAVSLIHVVPDQVLNWIGGHAPQLGQYAQQAGQSGEHGNRVIGAVIGGGSGRAQSGWQAERQVRAQEKGNAIAASIATGEKTSGFGERAAGIANKYREAAAEVDPMMRNMRMEAADLQRDQLKNSVEGAKSVSTKDDAKQAGHAPMNAEQRSQADAALNLVDSARAQAANAPLGSGSGNAGSTAEPRTSDTGARETPPAAAPPPPPPEAPPTTDRM